MNLLVCGGAGYIGATRAVQGDDPALQGLFSSAVPAVPENAKEPGWAPSANPA